MPAVWGILYLMLTENHLDFDYLDHFDAVTGKKAKKKTKSHFTPALIESLNFSSAWSSFLKPPSLHLGMGLQHTRSPFPPPALKNPKYLSWRKSIQLIPPSQTSVLEGNKAAFFVLFWMEGKTLVRRPRRTRKESQLLQTQKNPLHLHSSSLNNAPHGIKPRLVIAECSSP